MREHRKLDNVSATKWDKNALVKLHDLMIENMNIKYSSDAFTISLDQTSVSGESIDEVLNNYPFEDIDSINFRAINWNANDEIDKSITVNLRPTVADYQIHSTDEVWFRGKSSQLDEIFNDQKPWYGFIHSIFPSFVGAGIGVLLLLTFYLLSQDFVITAVITGVALLGLNFAFSLYLKGKIFPNTAFDIKDTKAVSYEIWTLFFTAIAAIATVVTLLIQIFSSDS